MYIYIYGQKAREAPAKGHLDGASASRVTVFVACVSSCIENDAGYCRDLVSLPPLPTPPPTHTPWASLSLARSLALSLFWSLSLGLSLSRSRSLSVSLSLSLSLSLSRSLSLSLSLFLSLSLSLSLSPAGGHLGGHWARGFEEECLQNENGEMERLGNGAWRLALGGAKTLGKCSAGGHLGRSYGRDGQNIPNTVTQVNGTPLFEAYDQTIRTHSDIQHATCPIYLMQSSCNHYAIIYTLTPLERRTSTGVDSGR